MLKIFACKQFCLDSERSLSGNMFSTRTLQFCIRFSIRVNMYNISTAITVVDINSLLFFFKFFNHIQMNHITAIRNPGDISRSIFRYLFAGHNEHILCNTCTR